MDLVSVIIPVYKVEAYLCECINSVVNQSYQNLEIILVDDGSPDRCPEICDTYANMDKRVRVIHKQNGGLSDARNAGIDAANGKWLAFVDSDDYIAPTMIEELYQAANNEKADMAVCSVLMFRDTDTGRIENDEAMALNTQTVTGQDILKSVKQTMRIPIVYVVAWNKLYRKELFYDLRYGKDLCHEDEAISHHILGKCRCVACVESCLYYYRQRSGSIMNQANNIKRLDALIAYADRIRYYEDKGLSDYSPPIQDYYFWELFDKYFLFPNTRQNKNRLLACRKATRSILPYYLKRKDVRFNVKMSVLIFCFFPKIYKRIWRKNT